MRTTSNPAFRNLPRGGYGNYAGFNSPPPAAGGTAMGYGGYGAPPTATDGRPLTIDDVVTKTAIMLGTVIVTAVLAALAIPQYQINPGILAAVGMFGGFILALVNIFKRKISPPLMLAYAVAEGLFLGSITWVVVQYLGSGIAMQAVAATAGVFIAMLVIYKTGVLKVTPRMYRMVAGVGGGLVVLILMSWILGVFNINTGIQGNGTLGILFCLAVIGFGAFSLMLDFDQADNMIRSGYPAKFAWYTAFGLTMTLVMLYLYILRLLAIMNSNN